MLLIVGAGIALLFGAKTAALVMLVSGVAWIGLGDAVEGITRAIQRRRA